jgi:hypothetical protein
MFSPKEAGVLLPIFWGGLISGALDITAAEFTIWRPRGITPLRGLQNIAAGLLGVRSFQGGLRTAILGAALHFLIAFTASAVFYGASRRLSFMTQQTVLSGALYGILVYLVMNLIVVPLCASMKGPSSVASVLVGVIVHMVCVGLPIAFTVRYFSR